VADLTGHANENPDRSERLTVSCTVLFPRREVATPLGGSMFRHTLITAVVVTLVSTVGCAADPETGGSSGASAAGGFGGSGGFGASGASGSGGFGALGGSGGFGAVGGDAGASATGGAGGFDMNMNGCTSIEDESPVSRGEVDIIWIIDNSCSMFEEYTNVKNNLNAFANDIFNAGIDHHVVTIVGAAVIPFISPAGDPAVGTQLGMDTTRYRYVAAEVGSNNLMGVLTQTFPQWGSFLRPAAPTHIVIVTDDESDTQAAQFKSTMDGLLGHPFIYHSIASENPKCLSAANAGIQHYALSDMTGGLKQSICLADWSPVFARLKDAVVASVPLPCEFTIPPPPMGMLFNKDFVNFEYTPDMGVAMPWPRADDVSVCGSQIGWYYDNVDTPTKILLCPTGCTNVSGGGKISIVFGCSQPPILLPE